MEIRATTSWGWICLLFAAQAIGSLAIAELFRMDLRDIYIPVLLLVIGAVISAIFRRYSNSRAFGAWQWWVPAAIYALFIFSLSNQSYPDAQPAFSTKVFHPIEYAVLGLLICVASLTALRKKGLPLFSAQVFSIGILFGISDEFHQAFIPGRTAHLTDVFFWDLMGIIGGWIVIMILRRFLPQRQ